jgi:tripartite-type tricarboxylate transporter receptor subunit TctC
MRNMAVARALSLALLLVSWFSQAAIAQTEPYPSRNIRLVVPFPAGGLVDAVGRLIAPPVEKVLGQPLIIDNRPAASGTTATQGVARADPDGYTLLLASSTHTVAPATNSKVPYDIERDLAPILVVAQTPPLFVVNPEVPAKTLGEFISLAKSQPNKLSYSSPGAASQGHLMSLLLSQLAGIEMLHVPYRGGAPALMGVIGGEVQFSVLSAQICIPQLEAGKLRALATGGRTRDKQLPGVPTLIESGFPNFQATQWVGLLAPAHTPQGIIDQLNAVFNRVLQDPEVVARLETQVMRPVGGTSGEFGKMISTELKQWTEVARQANVDSN